MTTLDLRPEDIGRFRTLFADAPEGTRIRLAPGDYPITQPLGFKTGVSVQGEPGKTRITTKRGPFFTTEAKVLSLSGLILDGADSGTASAVMIPRGARLEVDQCRFRANHASEGAVFAFSDVDRVSITRSVFEGNESVEGGGVMVVGSGGQIVCDRCSFIGNRSKVGGAIYLRSGGAIKLLHCTFVDNEASWPKGGGALFVLSAKSTGASAFIANCVFRGREAICADTSKDYQVFIRSSVVPPETFPQERIENVAGNTLARPDLIGLAGGLFGLASTSAGAGRADLKYTTENATDFLGNPLVRNGHADPGALVRSF